jgi:hypothetical protein
MLILNHVTAVSPESVLSLAINSAFHLTLPCFYEHCSKANFTTVSQVFSKCILISTSEIILAPSRKAEGIRKG